MDQQIQDIIQNVGKLWDQRQFKQAKQYFTDVVEIDYLSLGAPSITMDNIDQLENNWKTVLNGFDKTQHEISQIKIQSINDDELIVNSNITANHFIGKQFWSLEGTYVHKLQKINGIYKIKAMKLTVLNQKGNPELLIEATKRSQQQ